MEKRRLAEWHLVGWSVFLVAFIGAGAVTFDSLPRQMRVADQGPTNSSDAVLMGALGLANGSARISACLETLPPRSRIAVMYRPYQALCAELICLAAWDKGMSAVAIAEDSPDAKSDLENSGAVAAFWLWGTPPPSFFPPEVIIKELGFWHRRPATK